MTDEDFEEFFQKRQSPAKVEKFFQSFGNGTGMSSNSVQITGRKRKKNKIKIDSQNSDMTYIIDGQQAKDNVQMPDKIFECQHHPIERRCQKNPIYSSSRDRLGEFVSFQNGVLTF